MTATLAAGSPPADTAPALLDVQAVAHLLDCDPTVREAHEFLIYNGIEGVAELADYKAPDRLEVFQVAVSKGRADVEGPKNARRAGRLPGGSVVHAKDVETHRKTE